MWFLVIAAFCVGAIVGLIIGTIEEDNRHKRPKR